MSEFAPPSRKVKVTKSQMKKYVKDIEEQKNKAKKKIDQAKKSGEFDKEEKDLEKLENLIDDL